MEQKYKRYIAVMLNYGKFYVVVDCKDIADKRMTYVVCPFPSNKLRFVDMLDHRLKEAGLEGVLRYDCEREEDDELAFVTIDHSDTDLRRLIPIVYSALKELSELKGGELTDEDVRLMREFILATHRNWMTLGKYNLLNSIIDERRRD